MTLKSQCRFFILFFVRRTGNIFFSTAIIRCWSTARFTAYFCFSIILRWSFCFVGTLFRRCFARLLITSLFIYLRFFRLLRFTHFTGQLQPFPLNTQFPPCERIIQRNCSKFGGKNAFSGKSVLILLGCWGVSVKFPTKFWAVTIQPASFQGRTKYDYWPAS